MVVLDNDSPPAEGRIYKTTQWQYVQNGKRHCWWRGNDSQCRELCPLLSSLVVDGNDNLWGNITNDVSSMHAYSEKMAMTALCKYPKWLESRTTILKSKRP